VDPVPVPYLSENLVGPGIEPGTFGSVARNLIEILRALLKAKKYGK
jgi:hypothetical protein